MIEAGFDLGDRRGNITCGADVFQCYPDIVDPIQHHHCRGTADIEFLPFRNISYHVRGSFTISDTVGNSGEIKIETAGNRSFTFCTEKFADGKPEFAVSSNPGNTLGKQRLLHRPAAAAASHLH